VFLKRIAEPLEETNNLRRKGEKKKVDEAARTFLLKDVSSSLKKREAGTTFAGP